MNYGQAVNGESVSGFGERIERIGDLRALRQAQQPTGSASGRFGRLSNRQAQQPTGSASGRFGRLSNRQAQQPAGSASGCFGRLSNRQDRRAGASAGSATGRIGERALRQAQQPTGSASGRKRMERMRKKVVDLGEGVVVTVKEATVLDGLRRGALVEAAFSTLTPGPSPRASTGSANEGKETFGVLGNPEGLGEGEETVRIAQGVLYPAVVAGTAEVEGLEWPMTFVEFLELPERVVDAWLEAVYELNPHWRPGWAEKEEKKISTRKKERKSSTSGTSG